MTQIIKETIPPRVRQVAYIVFALLGVGFGATQTAYVTAEVAAPLWLSVAFQVYLYVGGALGLVAATNTTTPTATISGVDFEGEGELVFFDATTEPSLEGGDAGFISDSGYIPKHAE